VVSNDDFARRDFRQAKAAMNRRNPKIARITTIRTAGGKAETEKALRAISNPCYNPIRT